ncbi:MAG: hypothetical protein WAK55_18825 [Xanthobacteraceae bacterium]
MTSVAPCRTPHMPSVTPRLTSHLATGTPRSTPLFAPCHTGRCWTAWCGSGWLCLSLGI